MSTGFYITDGHGGCVYEYGKWAEILPSHPQITLNRNKVEFHKDFIKVGCTRVELKQIEEIANHYNPKTK
jgi:hypothetical protein